MSRSFGCNVTFAGQKCLSVRTDIQDDGTHEFLLSALGGPGTERHLHGYASLTSDAVMLWAGARLKEDIGEHLGSGILLRPGSTEEIGRVVIQPTSDGPQCVLKQVSGGQWFGTSPSTMGGTIRRSEVALPCSPGARGGEYSVSCFDSRSGVPSHLSQHVVIPFSDQLPFGIVFSKLTCY